MANNGQGAWERQAATTTLQSLRQPAKYWVVSDAQLKRDLAGRTLRDVYRDNRAGRGAASVKYVPRYDSQAVMLSSGGLYGRPQFGPGSDGGLFGPRKLTLRDEYLAECAARGHTPHPASLDPDHPRNCHREKAPRRDIAFVHSVPTPATDWPMKEAA
jgi:hypothetical protein